MLLRLSQDWLLSYGKKEDKNVVETGMYDERRISGDLSCNLFKNYALLLLVFVDYIVL